MAGGAEVRHAHGLVVQFVLLDDGGLDGHAVVIPAGNIGGVVAPHGVHTGDEVLDGLVQGVAHMQRAVGERRAVMEGEQGLALVLLQQLVIEVDLLPVLQHIRLALGKASPHGKAALWHVQRLFVFHVASPFLCEKFSYAKIKSAFVSSRDKGAVKRPLRYHSRCRARRPLSPTIRGRGVITARFRPCLLMLSAGCSGVISAPCPRPPCTETAALFASGCGAACPLHRVCTMFTMRYLLI